VPGAVPVPERVVRIASVPAAHPYVAGIAGPGHEVLASPPVPGAPPGQWWPPVVLSPDWLRDNAGEYDLVHVHFGTESLSLGRLAEALAALREVGRPLVYTAHDLDHPHLDDQDRHLDQLDLLVPQAAELLTLTDHAAGELRRRYGRTATVVPHPQVARDAWFARADVVRRARPASGPVVGLHLRSLRANVRPGPWIARLADAVADRGGRLHVLVNDGVDPGTAAGGALAELRTVLRGAPAELTVRPRPDDDVLALELASLDVSVLPYSHGTHSGWLELCWDLGVRVLSPAVGAIADQHHEPWAHQGFDPALPATIGPALDRLLDGPSPPPAGERLAERRRIADANRRAHAAAYARALGRPVPAGA
jgi:hypothetical protein